MEKYTPHYVLAEILAVIADPSSQPFTRSALQGGLALGLDEFAMRAVVLKLSRRCFYKSMTTFLDHTTWQDVYHGFAPDRTAVYIKITGYTDGRPPVIQFKRK